ncbi:MAG: TonB-dependent receptor [Caulobacter sp.]|nr:TonB-dependent receptor [Caulobacter sp.]
MGFDQQSQRLAARWALLSSAALCVLSPASAGAVEATSTRVDDVIVTALRRETTLAKTPVTVTSYGEAVLAVKGVTTLADLSGQTPGVTLLQAGPSNLRVAIRGVQSVGESTVGVYFDDVPINGSVGAGNDAGGGLPGLDLYDVQRVEILQGPQGTLYGAGAMGGAVKVLLNKPVFDTRASIKLDGFDREGGHAGLRVAAMANGVLASDRLAVRGVVTSASDGGYIRNVRLGRRHDDDLNHLGGRLMLRFTPDADTTLDASIHRQADNGELPLWDLRSGDFTDDAATRRANRDRLTLYTLSGERRFSSGRASVTLSRAERDFTQSNFDATLYFQSLVDNAAACARLRGGGATCSAPTMAAFNSYVRGFLPSAVEQVQHTNTNTAEARLTLGEGSRLVWTAGAFYSQRTGDFENRQVAADPTTGVLLTPRQLQFRRFLRETLSQASVFGDASWQATSDLTLSAGARWLRSSRSVEGQTFQGLDLLGVVVTPFSRVKAHEDAWAPRVNLAYDATPRLFLYAQAAKGFRPGGVNLVPALPSNLVSYRADSLWSYEAGARGQVLPGRLDVEIAAYRIDWRDMQVTGSRPDGLFKFIANAGAARIDGVEASLTGRLAKGLEVRLSGASQDPRLTEDQINASVAAPGRRGDRIPYVARTTAAASLDYARPVADLTAAFHVEAVYVGTSGSELRRTNAYYTRLPAATRLNARLSVTPDRGAWSASVYGENLTNEIALQSVNNSAPTVGRPYVTSAPPRTFGVTLDRRF